MIHDVTAEVRLSRGQAEGTDGKETRGKGGEEDFADKTLIYTKIFKTSKKCKTKNPKPTKFSVGYYSIIYMFTITSQKSWARQRKPRGWRKGSGWRA